MCMHTHTHGVHTRRHTCAHVCTHSYPYTAVHLYMHISTFMHTIHARTRMHTHMRTRAHTYPSFEPSSSYLHAGYCVCSESRLPLPPAHLDNPVISLSRLFLCVLFIAVIREWLLIYGFICFFLLTLPEDRDHTVTGEETSATEQVLRVRAEGLEAWLHRGCCRRVRQ